MPISKVKQFIRQLGAPKLTEEEIAKIKSHHEYHGDKLIKGIGSLPKKAVFVRVVDHMGFRDSIIDSFLYDGDVFEECYLHSASEDEEIDLIKQWLKEYPDEDIEILELFDKTKNKMEGK